MDGHLTEILRRQADNNKDTTMGSISDNKIKVNPTGLGQAL